MYSLSGLMMSAWVIVMSLTISPQVIVSPVVMTTMMGWVILTPSAVFQVVRVVSEVRMRRRMYWNQWKRIIKSRNFYFFFILFFHKSVKSQLPLLEKQTWRAHKITKQWDSLQSNSHDMWYKNMPTTTGTQYFVANQNNSLNEKCWHFSSVY